MLSQVRCLLVGQQSPGATIGLRLVGWLRANDQHIPV